jgi:hypothetical protein
MGSKTKTVKNPFESRTTGTRTSDPYAPIVPYLESALPQLESAFGQSTFFGGSLIPEDTAETLRSRELYGALGQQAAGFAPGLEDVYASQLGMVTAAPGTSALFGAEFNDLLNQARLAADASKINQAQSAIEAGQFGLGSTARSEAEALAASELERTTQAALAGALGREEAAKQAALSSLGGIRQDILGLGGMQAGLQEALGADIESRALARLAEQARLETGGAEELQNRLTTFVSMLGGLGSLGGTQTVDELTKGFGTQSMQKQTALGQAANIGATLGAAALKSKSDIRLKTEIKRVGKLPNGIPVYRWEWTKEAKEIVKDQPSFGVLAQEVLDYMPDAVRLGTDGYYEVDYGKVLNG